jgi:hypothetical protein
MPPAPHPGCLKAVLQVWVSPTMPHGLDLCVAAGICHYTLVSLPWVQDRCFVSQWVKPVAFWGESPPSQPPALGRHS